METKPNEKKKQKVSVSYTLKALAKHIKTLENEKIVTKEDAKIMQEIHKKAVKHWIGGEFEY